MPQASRRQVFLASAAAWMAGGAAGATAVIGEAGEGGRTPPRFPVDVEQRLAAGLKSAGVVGGAITLVHGGAMAGFLAHGLASVPFDVPVRPETLFQVGSVGKHVTAMAVLQLVEAGKLALDWPVGRVVPDLPGWIAALPIHDLLGHTSGVPDYEDGFAWDRPFPRDSFLAALKAPNFAPGEAWAYSNSGYVLLGYAIEAVSGQSYTDYVAQRLFSPAGLPLARRDAAGDAVIGRAEPYEVEAGVVRHATRMETKVSSMPDGGLLFSARDWAPWVMAIEKNRLIGPEMTAAMFKPGVLRSGQTTTYGCGWFIDRVRGKEIHYHSGGVPGFVTFVLHYPDARTFAVATLNSPPSKSVRPLLEEAIEAVAPNVTPLGLPGRPEIAKRDERLRAYLGGASGEDFMTRELLVGQKALGAKPGPRIKGKLEALALLETYPVAGGNVSRYRLTAGGVVTTRRIGWTSDDRIFLD